eukprot:scaffold918_cov126-Cylindrotheca_fusiformis.AAC.31
MPPHEGESSPPLTTSATTNDDSPKSFRKKREYRGIFSSSICDMFSSPKNSKTDACALACCGVWLWERNKFLLHGEYPKSWKQRPIETLVVCLLVACAVIWMIAPDSIVLRFCFIAAIVLGIWRRLEFKYSRSKFRTEMAVEEYKRQQILWSNNSEPGGGNENSGLQLYLNRNWDEIHRRRHQNCTCVRNDTFAVDEEEEDNRDFCQCLWQCLSNLCCNTCCSCWCLWYGMCAIAQEHRHLAQVLPDSPALWQRDYITMQPWSEYFPNILQLRNSKNMRFWDHVKALSTLSRRLIGAFGLFFVFAIVVTSLPVTYDRWQLAVMFGALLEPIVLLFFTYWYWNRLDLSTDAIIKYFSSGFFLCTSMVMVYELLASVASSLIVLVYSLAGTTILVMLGQVDLEDISEANVDEETIIVSAPGLSNSTSEEQWNDVLEFPTAFTLSITILRSFLSAFFVAAMVEELFKYLSFWMVEHPDLENDVSLTPVRAESPMDVEQIPNEETGLLSDPAQRQTYDDDQSLETITLITVMAKSKPHPTSLESRGAAITVAMIAVAVGFSCAENLLYIFVYTESNLVAEATTLALRALFPVHPLCAAIQSIGVVKRDIEKDKSVGVGRIIFAALLLHGSFDFLLMVYSAVMEVLNEDPLGENDSASTDDDKTTTADWIVLGCSLLIPLIGLEYFFYNSGLQTKRLRDLDSARDGNS